VVPDRIVFRLDRRMIPEETPAEVEAALRAQLAAAAARHPGITIDLRRVLLAMPFVPQPGWSASLGRSRSTRVTCSASTCRPPACRSIPTARH